MHWNSLSSPPPASGLNELTQHTASDSKNLREKGYLGQSLVA
jgi:hypothetical protein